MAFRPRPYLTQGLGELSRIQSGDVVGPFVSVALPAEVYAASDPPVCGVGGRISSMEYSRFSNAFMDISKSQRTSKDIV